ncbi:MAG: hypothetical protein E4H36_14200, partial [Spirochaetales bacterium]
MISIRKRLEQSLAGGLVQQPVYAVYDWFVQNRPIDWQELFDQGLGQVGHASLITAFYPHAEKVETLTEDEKGPRRDVRWITENGELHEWYRGEWRQEYLVKSPKDYAIIAKALEDTRFTFSDAAFDKAEASIGESGITFGQLGDLIHEVRTPLQAIQIDFAGLERFSLDLSDETPQLMDLIEQMNEQWLEKFRMVRESGAHMIKLWENMSIVTMGPEIFRRFLVPLYRKFLKILEGTGKGIHVHFDGKLRPIASDIAGLPFAGIDSLTGLPEGDLSAAEARALWPDKFFWLHPNLGWYQLPTAELKAAIRRTALDADNRFCMMISEEVPPDWHRSVPA